jgi:hypothetical protein
MLGVDSRLVLLSILKQAHRLYSNVYIYIYIYTKRITMCPPGYHHNGLMATPELGHRMYGILARSISHLNLYMHSVSEN